MDAKQLIPSLALAALAATFSSGAGATCWQAASERYAFDPIVLQAIAKVESSFNPAAMNRTNANATYDIGMMQINSAWLPKLKTFGIAESDLMDGCTNLHVGAWVLADLRSRMGWSWDTIGAYNVGCKSLTKNECARRRGIYITKIKAALEQLKAKPAQLARRADSSIMVVSMAVAQESGSSGEGEVR